MKQKLINFGLLAFMLALSMMFIAMIGEMPTKKEPYTVVDSISGIILIWLVFLTGYLFRKNINTSDNGKEKISSHP